MWLFSSKSGSIISIFFFFHTWILCGWWTGDYIHTYICWLFLCTFKPHRFPVICFALLFECLIPYLICTQFYQPINRSTILGRDTGSYFFVGWGEIIFPSSGLAQTKKKKITWWDLECSVAVSPNEVCHEGSIYPSYSVDKATKCRIIQSFGFDADIYSWPIENTIFRLFKLSL